MGLTPTAGRLICNQIFLGSTPNSSTNAWRAYTDKQSAVNRMILGSSPKPSAHMSQAMVANQSPKLKDKVQFLGDVQVQLDLWRVTLKDHF